MSYSEEKLLQFFGQLVGVAIRADVPIALDLLPCFWKSLKGEPLSLDDLREADCITYHLTQKLLAVRELPFFLTTLSLVFLFFPLSPSLPPSLPPPFLSLPLSLPPSPLLLPPSLPPSSPQCSSVEEFDELLSGLIHNQVQGDEGDTTSTVTYPQSLTFVYHTMTGQERELCSGGRYKQLTYVSL